MNWQDVITEVWPKVRRKHLWPELPTPTVGNIQAPVAMQMRDKHITLNTATCNELLEHMPAAEIVEALLDHGVSHYTRCPWDLATHLQLYATAKAELGRKSLARLATDTFIDVVANTACVKELPTPIPEVYRHLGGGALQGAMTALYTQIWGMQLHGSGDPALVRRLARIPYLDRQQWPRSLQRFVRLVRTLLEEEGRGRQPDPPPLGQHTLESYARSDITLGLQAFAQQTGDIKQFCDVVQDFANELVALGYGHDAGTGLGPQVDAEALYYMQLAQNYRLPVHGLPMERSGVMEPYSHAPWEASQPVQDIDIWTSFGRLLPGLSQIWKRRQGMLYGHKEGTPDCLIALDSSGSMPNPREQLSEAVLGAACAAEAYVRREAQVAVYNFSDALAGGKTILPFTSDRQAIYRALCAYHGGGTSLRPRDLADLRLLASSPSPDLLLITDMQLANLEDIIDYLAQAEGRITVVHIGENPSTDRFRHATRHHPRLHIFTVLERQDIPKIILGQMQRYLSGLQAPR
ncbi:MAG: hypothetical protein AB7N91_29790 [Candidatus Tectimicrobiota bacterium]